MITSLGISWTIFTYCFVYSVFLSVSFTWKRSYQRYNMYILSIYIYVYDMCNTFPMGFLVNGFHDQRVSMGVEVSHHPSPRIHGFRTRYCLLWCSWERGKSSSSTGFGSRGQGNPKKDFSGWWWWQLKYFWYWKIFLGTMHPFLSSYFSKGLVQPPTIVFFVYKNSVPSWEVTYPFPVGTFESMILLFPFGGICFLVPWRVPLQRNEECILKMMEICWAWVMNKTPKFFATYLKGILG